MTEFFKNTAASLRYDPSTKLVYQKAEDVPINPVHVKDCLMAIMKFVEKSEVKGLVVDISKVKGTFSMLNDYIATVYTPKIMSHGVSFNAVVVSNDIFTKFATDQLVQKIQDFEIRTFENFKEAETWAIQRAGSQKKYSQQGESYPERLGKGDSPGDPRLRQHSRWDILYPGAG